MYVRKSVSVLALAVSITVLGLSAKADTAICDSLKASYHSGFNNMVSEVRSKSPMLLVAYASKLGGGRTSQVPSQAKALNALNSVKPACISSLGTAVCNRLLGNARSFIGRSTALNHQFAAKGCPGTLAD